MSIWRSLMSLEQLNNHKDTLNSTLGMAFMAVFLGCLEYTLEEGPRWDWFGDDTIRTTAWIAASIARCWMTDPPGGSSNRTFFGLGLSGSNVWRPARISAT